jgi:hypothetical protein
MSRVKAISIAVPTAHDWQAVGHRLVPLWRHGVWLVALFALLTLWVDIRVDVQQLRSDLDRASRAQREARIQNERLRLELDARRRALAMESLAASTGTVEGASVIVVGQLAPVTVAAPASELMAGGAALPLEGL